MKLVKEKFRFVFCTLHALMRWAKKRRKTLNQLRIDCNSSSFRFFFFVLTSFCYELSFLYESIFRSTRKQFIMEMKKTL